MTVLAAGALQMALYDRLNEDAALMAMISGIYDHVPRKTALPYLTIGDDQVRDWSGKDFVGEEHLFDIHLWSGARGSREVKDLADRVHALMEGGMLSVPGYDLVSLQFIFFENFFEADGRVRHGILRYRARLMRIS
ncbi:DUF3168 domain-containing protein [Luteithermobacter gelatinilyticus]|uniref:DUF3168 domain-containing protein n=1 Tax=Luteithermobacter gelatinilyticus TaxID=2582913 RepID=UPI0011060E06|nr:DUF3168 domain-containing protein [Luteithermobacter gelatinilyticus]